jgi:hypothetical protein
VNDVVTVTVQQAQVVEGVVGVVLVVMMHLYRVICREAQPTECATTTLSLEQPCDPSRFAWITPQPAQAAVEVRMLWLLHHGHRRYVQAVDHLGACRAAQRGSRSNCNWVSTLS